jgi:hypothetical protein
MKTTVAGLVVLLVLAVGGAQASLVELDFANSGGDGYQLLSGGVLSFDNLVVTGSSNSDDIMGYAVTIGSLTIDVASRSEFTFMGTSIVTYGFSVDTAAFGIWDPTLTTQYIAGALTVGNLVIVNGTGVTLDADSDLDDITGLTAMNNPAAQTLLDLASAGQAGFTLALTIDPMLNLDTLIQNSAAGAGPAAGSVAIPEPASMALLGFGLAAIFVRRRR